MRGDNRTPRTLAECEFRTGYPSASIHRRDRFAGWMLAIVIGAALAVLLLWELAQ